MRVRDLPRALLLTYTSIVQSHQLPPEWIDLDFIPFLCWLDAARKDVPGAVSRWEEVRQLHHEASLLMLPVIEKCPALSLNEALEMLPAPEQARCLAILKQLALIA